LGTRLVDINAELSDESNARDATFLDKYWVYIVVSFVFLGFVVGAFRIQILRLRKDRSELGKALDSSYQLQ